MSKKKAGFFEEINLDIGGGLFDEEPEYNEKEHPKNPSVALNQRTAYKTRRAFSEYALDEVLEWQLEPGTTYYIISGGDIDSLTYLRRICKTQTVEYCIFSTWAMGSADTVEIGNWLARGIIKRIDAYVSDNIEDPRPLVWQELSRVLPQYGGRAALSWIHAKIMVVFGTEYDCVILSSANLNTNTRVEQTTITTEPGVAQFFKDYFDKMQVIRDEKPADWAPWTRSPEE